MPRIYVEFSQLDQLGSRYKSVASKVDSIQEDFQRTVRQLDWDIRFESNINSTATQLSRKLNQYSKALEAFQRFIEDAHNEYIKLDEYKRTSSFDSIFIGVKPINIAILGPGGNPFADRTLTITDKIKEYFSDIDNEKDSLSILKTLLNGADKYGDNDEAGVLKDAISYFQDLASFFNGDKKGLTGASDWCNLANSSIGLWSGLYDYFQDMYDGIKTGFFGDTAQKNVKVLGLSSGFLGLTASILSASNGLDTKQWQSIVADYTDCGKDILSIISSGYELKNIGNVKSLAEMKAGPWNALGIYSAIGEAGIQSISQGFRSHEKYYSDGQWDLGDTGATGIDISMAGIYSLSHKLTGGLDDLIYGVIDSATGGDGNSDMSYYEKAAEGYKILANRCGEAIGNWWLNLTT
ncbi:MAG: hypothetical protein UHS54_00675 [Lachnospiraceae bacterium]|nr:hypothetical protein [Lachnospiraceae bacterium]